MDLKAESETGSAGCMGCLSFVLGAGAAVVWAGPMADEGMASLSDPPGMCMAVVVAICLLAVVYNLVRYFRYSSYDIPNDFREVFLPVLDALRSDIPRKCRVQCDLDLRGSVLEQKKVQRPDTGWQGTWMFSKEHRDYYEDPWCTFQAKMSDGCTLHLEFWNEVLELMRIRGRKNKRKYKYKKVAFVRITLVPPGGVFTWDDKDLGAGTFEGPTKVKPKEKNGVPIYRLVHKTKVSERGSCPETGVPPETTLKLLMQLYSSLDPKTKDGGSP
jgi:hypothetical protein